jgi:sodium-dependent dicarboxylate transporter 2/3/5
MMFATFFLPMFVSNTATTLMMVPNAISVCTTVEVNSKSESFLKESKKFAIALMLGIAYAANVGGMASLVGTVSNLVFQRHLELLFPDSPEFTFAQWIAFGLTIGIILFLIIWVYLCLMYLRNFKGNDTKIDSSIFRDQYLALGSWTREQVSVCGLFLLLCVLWIFRADLNFGSFRIPGWSNIFPEPSYISDGTTGMLIAFVMFVCPARTSMLTEEEEEMDTKNEDPGEEEDETPAKLDTTLLDWDTANKMPYASPYTFMIPAIMACSCAFVLPLFCPSLLHRTWSFSRRDACQCEK